MTISSADAIWNGTIKEGAGKVHLHSKAFEGEYTFASRFETAKGTNPEELIAAAHAACYSMQLSGLLTAAGKPPKDIRTTARVEVIPGKGITSIALETVAHVPGIDPGEFMETAGKAKEICPVSRALASVPDISLKATLK